MVNIVLGHGLLPVWRQAITWTNDDLLSAGAVGTNLIEILIIIQQYSFKEIHMEMSAKSGQFVQPLIP